MMVNQQGEQLDMASDNVMTSEANVSQARQHLETSEKVRVFVCVCLEPVLI
jgi:t-SNARE complex subunit (syntaxin)